MNILEVKDLCKTYIVNKRQNNVLKNVSFTISEGEMAAVMGPSGSGDCVKIRPSQQKPYKQRVCADLVLFHFTTKSTKLKAAEEILWKQDTA